MKKKYIGVSIGFALVCSILLYTSYKMRMEVPEVLVHNFNNYKVEQRQDQWGSYYILHKENQPKLYAEEVSRQGFEGLIEALLLINIDENKIEQVNIISHKETLEYGGYVDKPWFLNRFKDKSLDKHLKLVKMMEQSEEEIVAITGATITSQALIDGINQGMDHFKERIKDEEY